MTLNLSMPHQDDLKPRITVFGVGGAGGNAVNNMIEKQLEGVDFVVANTDAQALAQNASDSRIQLGAKITEGLGAGARATVGAAAAEESIEQIVDHLTGAHMCFITAGMGGGTGTGAAPIIAQAARELGVLTVGVVTKPFQFEGAKRMRQAEEGVEELQRVVDTLIIIPNQNLFRLATEKTTFTEAFSLADDVLYQGVKGVTDLMVRPGLINLDFADVRAVMDEMGKAMMGTGEAEGEDRAIQAAEKAIANPLLDEISLKGAKGVLINITGAHDLTLFELDEAANRIREEVDPDANIIVGSTLDTAMEGAMRVSVVATGIDASTSAADTPMPRRSMAAPLRQTVSVEERKTDLAASVVEPAPEVVEEPAVAMVDDSPEGEEPNLFAVIDTPQVDENDDLPPPAYTPDVPAFEPRVDTYDEPQTQVAAAAEPRVSLQALRDTERTGKGEGIGLGPAELGSRASEPPVEEKRGFGLNSLINRMTGSASDQPERQARTVAPQPAQAAPRVRPAPTHFDATSDENEDKIEIPAFLRRQAN
ncbi:MAG: cell division protein FtsZ [Rhodobacteraceae bacterium]|nr:cell division protein FtsZ [Paracoccaceae bacterium]